MAIIRTFKDLDAWKEGHFLVLKIYLITKNFPKEEQFGLSNQLRRAAVSITSNIAEGFSRGSYREKIQFYSIALGSLTEMQSQLEVSRGIGYISREQFNELDFYTVKVGKIIHGLIKGSKRILLKPNSEFQIPNSTHV